MIILAQFHNNFPLWLIWCSKGVNGPNTRAKFPQTWKKPCLKIRDKLYKDLK